MNAPRSRAGSRAWQGAELQRSWGAMSQTTSLTLRRRGGRKLTGRWRTGQCLTTRTITAKAGRGRRDDFCLGFTHKSMMSR